MANKCFIKRNGQWERLSPMKKVNGQWQRCPVYKKENGVWNRIDQQLVDKYYAITGGLDWSYCYIGESSSDTSLYIKSTDPYNPRQGKYSSYYYYSPMSFKSTFDRVRNKDIMSIEITMNCEHSYYSTGLSTYISGYTGSNTSAPSSLTTSVFNNKRYSDDVKFSKGSTITFSLNSTAIEDIKSGAIHGFRPVSPSGWSLSDYGYFATNPTIRITYREQVWE